MPKVIMEFNLPDEQEEFENFNNASKYQRVLYDLDNYLRNIIKYTPDIKEENLDLHQKIRDKLYELLNDNGVSI